MKANQLAILILRLLGIYVLVEAIPLILFSFATTYTVVSNGASPRVFWTLIFIGSRVIIGILLIIFSRPWGEKLTPKTNDSENVSPITFRQVQVLAFAVAGALIFASALPQLLTSIFTLLRSIPLGDSVNDPYEISHNQLTTESALGILLKAALGIWLFFGADGFANFLVMRNFSTPKPPQTQ